MRYFSEVITTRAIFPSVTIWRKVPYSIFSPAAAPPIRLNMTRKAITSHMSDSSSMVPRFPGPPGMGVSGFLLLGVFGLFGPGVGIPNVPFVCEIMRK